MNSKLALALSCLFLLAFCEDGSPTESTLQEQSLVSSKKAQSKGAVLKDNLTLDQLSETVNSNEHVFVLFNSNHSDHAKYNRILNSLFKHFAKNELVFARVETSEEQMETLKPLNITVVPSFYLYIAGIKKHYTGELKLQNLKVWIKEVLEAKPLRRKTIADIENIDQHYFVFASAKTITKEKRKFEILAKLISPLSIYTGFGVAEIKKLTGDKKLKSGFWVFREYQMEVTELDISKSLEETSHFIISNEFPTNMICDVSALRFIRDFKIPVLAYFASTDNDAAWQTIKTVGAEFKEYALTILVRPKAKDRCSNFLRRFLNVSSTPALRILSLAGKVKRHMFLGTLDEQHIRFFMSHYVSGNLKSYSINQKVSSKSELKGIKQANYKIFKQAMTDYNRTYLFYIYSGDVKSIGKDLRAIKRLQDKIKSNKTISIYVIDHDRNDLDGYYNNSLPLVFLVAKKGKLVHFDEKKITTKALSEFISSHVPYLKGISEPISNDL